MGAKFMFILNESVFKHGVTTDFIEEITVESSPCKQIWLQTTKTSSSLAYRYPGLAIPFDESNHSTC